MKKLVIELREGEGENGSDDITILCDASYEDLSLMLISAMESHKLFHDAIEFADEYYHKFSAKGKPIGKLQFRQESKIKEEEEKN
jgi:hypothetical protein